MAAGDVPRGLPRQTSVIRKKSATRARKIRNIGPLIWREEKEGYSTNERENDGKFAWLIRFY
jgi:hypothetical protein